MPDLCLNQFVFLPSFLPGKILHLNQSPSLSYDKAVSKLIKVIVTVWLNLKDWSWFSEKRRNERDKRSRKEWEIESVSLGDIGICHSATVRFGGPQLTQKRIWPKHWATYIVLFGLTYMALVVELFYRLLEKLITSRGIGKQQFEYAFRTRTCHLFPS